MSNDTEHVLIFVLLALAFWQIDKARKDVERLAARVDNPPVVQLDRADDGRAGEKFGGRVDDDPSGPADGDRERKPRKLLIADEPAAAVHEPGAHDRHGNGADVRDGERAEDAPESGARPVLVQFEPDADAREAIEDAGRARKRAEDGNEEADGCRGHARETTTTPAVAQEEATR